MADPGRKRMYNATMKSKNPYAKFSEEQLNYEIEKLTGMSVDGAAASLPPDDNTINSEPSEPGAKKAKITPKETLDADLALHDPSALHVHIYPTNESDYAKFQKINPYKIMDQILSYARECKEVCI